MNAKPLFVAVLAIAVIAGYLGFNTIGRAQQPGGGKAATDSAAAAKKFIASLDDAQRSKVLFDYNDSAQRKRWSNLPQGAFQRVGVRMGDLKAEQREAAMAILAAALSKSGYQKVMEIVEADETLKTSSGGRGGPGGGAGAGGPPGGR